MVEDGGKSDDGDADNRDCNARPVDGTQVLMAIAYREERAEQEDRAPEDLPDTRDELEKRNAL